MSKQHRYDRADTDAARTTGIDKTALTLFDKGCGVQDDLGGGIFNTVPQGFDITKDGKVYYLRVFNAENSKFRMSEKATARTSSIGTNKSSGGLSSNTAAICSLTYGGDDIAGGQLMG
ncbi:MAG: hypothetical protein J6X69_07225 [Bacteroidales bacterium]|nr:hypothetical protein [Bacteroidales bacterium]